MSLDQNGKIKICESIANMLQLLQVTNEEMAEILFMMLAGKIIESSDDIDAAVEHSADIMARMLQMFDAYSKYKMSHWKNKEEIIQ